MSADVTILSASATAVSSLLLLSFFLTIFCVILAEYFDIKHLYLSFFEGLNNFGWLSENGRITFLYPLNV
jgi:hypothetical protein